MVPARSVIRKYAFGKRTAERLGGVRLDGGGGASDSVKVNNAAGCSTQSHLACFCMRGARTAVHPPEGHLTLRYAEISSDVKGKKPYGIGDMSGRLIVRISKVKVTLVQITK